MASDTSNDIGGKVSLDLTEFKAGAADLGRQVKVIESGFRAVAASMDDWSKSEEGLRLRINSLNQVTDLQKQKVANLTEQYKLVAAAKGEDSAQAQNLQNKINNETATLNKNLKELESNETALKNFNSEIKKNNLEDLGTKIENSQKKMVNLRSTLTGIATAAVGGFGLFEFAKGAIDAGNNAYILSQKLHVSTTEAASLNKMLAVTGVSAQPLISTISKLDKSLESAGDKGNATTKMLKEYGITLTDAHGKLLPIPKQLDALAAAYQKASDAGNEEAFTSEVLGTKGAQLIPLLEDYTKAKEEAAAVKGIGVDPAEAHQAEQQLTVLKLQLSAFSGILAKSLVPVVSMVIPPIITTLQQLAGVVKTHKAQLDNLVKSVVSAGKDIATTITPVIKTLFTFLTTNGGATKLAIEGVIGALAGFKIISSFAGPFSITTGIIGNFKTAILELSTAPTILGGLKGAFAAIFGFNPIILGVVAGIAALTTGIIYLWNTSSGFRTAVEGIWNGIGTVVGTAVTGIKNILITVWTDIQTITTTVWGYIGPTIIGAVTQIKSFWDAVWPEIKQIFQTVWEAIETVIAPVMAALYVAISTGIGIIKGIWGPAWNVLKDSLKTAWDAMTGVIKVVWDVISGVVKVGLDLLTGHWSQAWTDFKNIFKNLWDDLGNLIKNIGKDALQWGKDIIMGLWNGIKGGIKGLEDGVKGVAQMIRSYLHFSTPDVGPLVDYATWMPDFMKGLAKGITDNKGLITNAMQGLTDSMSTNAKITNTSTIANVITQTDTKDTDKTNEQNGQNLNESLGKGITDSTDKVTTPVNNLATAVDTTMTNMATLMNKTGQDVDTNLGTGVTNNANATINPVNTVIATVTNNVKTFTQSCIGHGQDTDTNLGTGVTNNSAAVTGAMNNVTTTLGNSLNTFATGAIQYGQSIDTSITNGITNTASSVVGSMSTLLNTIGNMLQTFATSCTTIGTAIVTSIGDGIKSSQDNLTTIVHNLTQKVIEAFTGPDGFDIRSPSRKLFEIGSYVIQGFINGLSSKDAMAFFQSKIGGAISNVSGNVASWLSTALALTGTPMSWLPGLLKLTSYESGDPGVLGTGSATLVNSVPVGNEYATGLLQTLPSTFREYMMAGFGNILNPIDNAIAAINYIKRTYGSVFNTPLFTSGGTYMGYASGTNSAMAGIAAINEKGWEWVDFSGGEVIKSHQDSVNMLNQAASAINAMNNALSNMKLATQSTINTNTSTTSNSSSNLSIDGDVSITLEMEGKATAQVVMPWIEILQGKNLRKKLKGVTG